MTLAQGDYVLATKYSDGDPGDHWCVGWYSHSDGERHFVADQEGQQYRANGFRRARRISRETGDWLVANMRALESTPPGAVNLWGVVRRQGAWGQLLRDYLSRPTSPASSTPSPLLAAPYPDEQQLPYSGPNDAGSISPDRDR